MGDILITFLVAGKVPGTDVYLSFSWVLIIVAVFVYFVVNHSLTYRLLEKFGLVSLIWLLVNLTVDSFLYAVSKFETKSKINSLATQTKYYSLQFYNYTKAKIIQLELKQKSLHLIERIKAYNFNQRLINFGHEVEARLINIGLRRSN